MLTLDLSVETQRALETRAAEHGKTAEAEAQSIVEAAVASVVTPGLGTQLREIFLKYGESLPDIVRDKSPCEPANFD